MRKGLYMDQTSDDHSQKDEARCVTLLKLDDHQRQFRHWCQTAVE